MSLRVHRPPHTRLPRKKFTRIVNEPDLPQNVMVSSLVPIIGVNQFSRICVILLKNKHTNQQINTGENRTSSAEVTNVKDHVNEI